MNAQVNSTALAGTTVCVVVVGYGHEDTARARSQVEQVVRRDDVRIITVDTSMLLPLDDCSGINDAFEFSGYEYGLKVACSQTGVTEEAGNDEDKFCIIFVNSTTFTAHLGSIHRVFFRQVLTGHLSQPDRPMAIGLSWNVGSPLSLVATLGWYFATNLFCITGTRSAIRSFQFFDRAEIRAFREGHFDRLPGPYNTAVVAWLRPGSFMGGWYKASPYARLADHELVRKRITIFLEHSLPGRFASAGFGFLSMNSDLPLVTRCLFRLMIFLDRCFVNLLKLRSRVLQLAFRPGEGAESR